VHPDLFGPSLTSYGLHKRPVSPRFLNCSTRNCFCWSVNRVFFLIVFKGPALCKRWLSITSLHITLKSRNSFVTLHQLASVQSRCFIIQNFFLKCYFMSSCITVCLQVGKMAARFEASFFRVGKEHTLLPVIKISFRQFSKTGQLSKLAHFLYSCMDEPELQVVIVQLLRSWLMELASTIPNWRLTLELASLSASLATSSNAWDSCAEKGERLSSKSPTYSHTSLQCSFAPGLKIGVATILLILLYGALWYPRSDNVWISYCSHMQCSLAPGHEIGVATIFLTSVPLDYWHITQITADVTRNCTTVYFSCRFVHSSHFTEREQGTGFSAGFKHFALFGWLKIAASTIFTRSKIEKCFKPAETIQKGLLRRSCFFFFRSFFVSVSF